MIQPLAYSRLFISLGGRNFGRNDFRAGRKPVGAVIEGVNESAGARNSPPWTRRGGCANKQISRSLLSWRRRGGCSRNSNLCLNNHPVSGLLRQEETRLRVPLR